MNTKPDGDMSRRFYILNAWVALILLLTVAVSIFQFGAKAWQGDKLLGFVIDGARSEEGWYRTQCRGIEAASRALNYELMLRDGIAPEGTLSTVAEMVGRGARVIFLVNNPSADDLSVLSKLYPNVRFYTPGATTGLPNVVHYGAQLVDVEYLAGMLAGLNTQTGHVGYVAPTSTAETNQYINAFTLGVQRTNPAAEVILFWSGGLNNPVGESQAVMTLRAELVDTLSYFQTGNTVPNTSQFVGIDFIASHEDYPHHSHYLGYVKVDWALFYADLLRRYGKQGDEGSRVARLMPLVDFELSDRVSPRQRSILETARWETKRGKPVFVGEIYDRRGGKRCDKDEAISYEGLRRMDWLVRGVRSIGN